MTLGRRGERRRAEPMATSASGGGGGAADPGEAREGGPSREESVTPSRGCRFSRGGRSRWRRQRRRRGGIRRAARHWSAPIRRRAASGAHAVADVVADAAGAAGRRTVWPGRSGRTGADPRSGGKRARLPISTDIRPCRRCRKLQPESIAPPPEQQPCGILAQPGGGAACLRPRRAPRRPNAPQRDGVQPCARRSASSSRLSPMRRHRFSTRPSHRRPAPTAPAPASEAHRRQPAPPRRMVVAALRRRRINAPSCQTQKPPGKTGRFFCLVKIE